MSAPYEIVVSPGTVWLASVGTTFPEVDAAPSGSWTKLGTSGNLNYDDGGVTVTHGQTQATFSGAGSTAKRKAFRTDETATVAFSLVDMTPEQIALVMDNLAVATRAADGTHAGIKTIELLRGPQVHTYALLVRAASSVDDSLTMQFQLPACYQAGNPAPALAKGAPAMLALEFDGLQVTSGVLAQWVIQTAPHS